MIVDDGGDSGDEDGDNSDDSGDFGDGDCDSGDVEFCRKWADCARRVTSKHECELSNDIICVDAGLPKYFIDGGRRQRKSESSSSVTLTLTLN